MAISEIGGLLLSGYQINKGRNRYTSRESSFSVVAR